MGKAIEAIALERGHSIAVTIDNEQEWSEREDRLEQCDIAIDFSQPDTAVGNIRRCIAKRLPIVVGTTGWYDQLETLKRECVAADSALFVASNFSTRESAAEKPGTGRSCPSSSSTPTAPFTATALTKRYSPENEIGGVTSSPVPSIEAKPSRRSFASPIAAL